MWLLLRMKRCSWTDLPVSGSRNVSHWAGESGCLGSGVCITTLSSFWFPQKAVRDRDFEALQGKVQRLEKLRRALKVDRNELKKKVQSLGGQTGGTAEAPTSDPGTDSPSPPPSDTLPELDPTEPGPAEPGPACCPPCQSEPQADPLQEEAAPAPEWKRPAPPESNHQPTIRCSSEALNETHAFLYSHLKTDSCPPSRQMV